MASGGSVTKSAAGRSLFSPSTHQVPWNLVSGGSVTKSAAGRCRATGPTGRHVVWGYVTPHISRTCAIATHDISRI
jgi:hypothetical protein